MGETQKGLAVLEANLGFMACSIPISRWIAMNTVRIVSSRDALDALQGPWSQLSEGNLMRSWDLHRGWFEHFGRGDAVRTLVWTVEGVVTGILPLAETRHMLRGRTWMLSGGGKACLDEQGIIARPESQSDAAEAFARFLLESKDCDWDYLDLDGVRDDDVGIRELVSKLERFGAAAEQRPGFHCWDIVLSPNTEGSHHWPKRLRSMMKKAKQERAEGHFRIAVEQTAEGMRAALKTIEDLHQERWRDRGIHGCFSNESFGPYINDLIDRLAPRGNAFTALLHYGETPSAGAFGFITSDRLYIYVTCMNPQMGEQKPGWKLNGFLADFALQRGCQYVDFMRGDEIYKQRLGGEPHSQSRWLVSAPSLRGRLHRTLYETARGVKNLIRLPVPISQPMPTTETPIG